MSSYNGYRETDKTNRELTMAGQEDWWDTGLFTNPDAQPTGGGSQPFGGAGGGQPVGGGGSQPKRSGPDWGSFQPGKSMRGDAQDADSGAQPSWGNGDGGDNEFATRGDLDEAMSGLHDKIDSLAAGGQASGPDGGPGRNNAFGQGTGRTPAPQAAQRPPTVLEQFGAHRAKVLGQMADSHAALQAGQNRRAQIQAGRAASFRPVGPSLSGNGMSASSGANTLNGLVSTGNAGGNGMSASTFNAKKWAQQ